MTRRAVALRVLFGATTLLGVASAPNASAACAGRPTDAAGYQGYTYGAAAVMSYATSRVRVHYATSGLHMPDLTSTRGDGVPDSVGIAGDIGEDALTRYETMGYRKPPSDTGCSANGGDDKVDIYLVAFAGADGTTVSESCTGASCASFVLCASSFTGRGYGSAKEGFQTVVSHELFHAVQNAYNSEMERFWAEGSAQWAMKMLHPDLADFEHQLPAFFSDPTRSLDGTASGVTAGFLYGSAVWPLFLATKYDADAVRAILDREADGTGAIAATDAVLQAKGSSMAEAFPLFAAWNVATKSLAGTGGYPDAAKYPGVKTMALEDGAAAITSGLSYYAYKGTLDASQKISLDTDATRNGGVVVPLEGGKAKLEAAQKLPATVPAGDVIVVVAGITTKKTDAPFTLHLGAPEVASSGGGGGGGGESGGCAVTTSSTRGGAWLSLVALGLLGWRKRRAR